MMKFHSFAGSRLLLAVTVGAALAVPAWMAFCAEKKDAPAEQASAPPQVEYDVSKLPDGVAEMRADILEAARSGELELMVPVLQSNELMPLLADKRVEDPVAFFKQISADGTGRDILAAMVDVLESGYVKQTVGGAETYIWPYFAEIPLDDLTPAQQVDLFRVVPPAEVKAMRDAGKYLHYSLGIGPDGTWHYFVKNK